MTDPAAAFGDAAALYARLRPGYPEEVFEALCAALDGPMAQAVDLGAGAGQASVGLAERFDRVTAIEPDARMAKEIPASKTIEVIIGGAEDISFEPASIDAVISATAFHWMDQQKICAHVFEWLRGGGVFFPFLYDEFRLKGAAAPVHEKHREKWRAYKDERLTENVDYAALIERSGLFSRVERFETDMEKPLSAADAAGLLATASFVRAYAHDHGGIDAYQAILADEIAAAGSIVIVGFPVSGALAVKAAAI